MSKKTFPLSKDELEEIIKKYPTPFHIYDEHAIRENIRKLQKAFAWAPRFREQFAVKALPNPRILQVLHEEGAGTDNSSLAELVLSEVSGYKGEEILLTSNDTPADEFQKAIELVPSSTSTTSATSITSRRTLACRRSSASATTRATSSRAMTSSASRRKRSTA